MTEGQVEAVWGLSHASAFLNFDSQLLMRDSTQQCSKSIPKAHLLKHIFATLEQGYYKWYRLFRFGLVRSYGLLSEPDLACSAFDEMQRLQIWQPTHVKIANALLNAVHADATTTYARYMHICSMPWAQCVTQQADVVEHKVAPHVKCMSHCHGIICAS